MSRHQGFTLIELLVVFFVLIVMIVVITGILSPSIGSREIASRAVCATNVRGIIQTMHVYADANRDWFPVAGDRDLTGKVHGFDHRLRGREDVKSDDPAMVNNVTASLWLPVRNGSIGAKSFICPASGNRKDMLLDAGVISLVQTWDFAGAENLSYSLINMYHAAAKMQWNANVSPAFVLFGDSNNADGPQVHTLDQTDRHDAKAIANLENSSNHYGDGQNFAYGDGHVAWSSNPFVGPGDDNVYAAKVDGKNLGPTLGNAGGEDDVLLPLVGNNGQSLSGLAGAGWRMRPDTYRLLWAGGVLLMVVGAAVGICLLIDGLRSLARGSRSRTF